MSASIVNIGTAEAVVPEAWLKVSTTPDFSNGYVALSDIALAPAASGDRVLAVGEEDRFDVRGPFSEGVALPLGIHGTHYVQLWLNPDRSKNFTNPESRVMPSYASPELDPTNNLSAIVSFERVRPETLVTPDCTPDAFEENDSLGAAVPITVETDYEINPCDDWLDVFSLELQAGAAVEIVMVDDSTDWYRSVVSPEGTYLVRDEWNGTSIVRAESTGTYYIAFRPVEFGVAGGRTNIFTIRALR